MIKNGDNVILKFSTIWDGELCRDHGKAYIYPSMDRAIQYYHPNHEVLVEYTPVRHGRWETHNQVDNVFYCSMCKLNVSNFERRWLNYCPYCGAKMDGDINEN